MKKGADMMKMMTFLRTSLLLVIAVVFCSGFALIGKGYQVYKEAESRIGLSEKVQEIRSKDTFTSIEDLPETYVNAVVAVEDKRFFRHPGIDFLAVGRALLHDIQAGRYVEGGSTITQQLAKNLYFSQEKQLTRKIAEVFVALDLERSYSKEEIFELYVNSIYFGDGYYGIGSASMGYFELEPSKMSDYESTLLAGVPNAPSRYAPSKYLDRAEKRQLQVLRRMEACGYYSREEAETVAETAALAFAN